MTCRGRTGRATSAEATGPIIPAVDLRIAARTGALRTPVGVVGAVEAMRSGWPHFHALLDVGGLAGWEIEVMGRLWFKIAGRNKIREVWKSGADAFAVYCAKYLNKDLGSGDLIFTDELLKKRDSVQLPLVLRHGIV